MYCLLNLGLTGLGLPSFVFFLGDVIDSFGPTQDKYEALEVIKDITIKITLIGIAIWISSALFYGCLLAFSEKVARRTKVAYFRSVLI